MKNQKKLFLCFWVSWMAWRNRVFPYKIKNGFGGKAFVAAGVEGGDKKGVGRVVEENIEKDV